MSSEAEQERGRVEPELPPGQPAARPGAVRGEQIAVPPTPDQPSALPVPHGGTQPCPACGGGFDAEGGLASGSYVYAIGQVVPRFPSVAIEKEFTQVVSLSETAGMTDRAVLQHVLSENRYLAREICWVFTIEGLETYILQPRDPADLEHLVQSVRPTPSPLDIDLIIGRRGPIAPPSLCNGLMVPVVVFDQLYSFDRDKLIKDIPRPEKPTDESFASVAARVFDHVAQMADNAGATDEHRALNYCVVRHPGVYRAAWEAHERNASFSGIEVRPSRLSGARTIVDVILSFTDRSSGVTEKCFTRVDVTEKFPFLVTKMSTYFDR